MKKKSAYITPSPPPDLVQAEQGEMPDNAPPARKGCRKLILVSILATALTAGLVILGHQDVNYYEYGFVKRRSTGKVDTSKVYTSGRYFVGPDYYFKKFKADAHFEDMSPTVFTSDKFQVKISYAFQYFLKTEDLLDLHEEYDLFYQPVIRSAALSSIKDQAASISMDHYLRQRAFVEEQLFRSLKDRLSGICCRKNCNSTNPCKPGCKPRSTCSRADKGLFVDVGSFQLHAVFIPKEVEKRYLSQVIEEANQKEENYVQQEQIVRKETEMMTQQIKNEAYVITQNATAQANLIKTRARSQALVKVEEAKNNGLAIIYSRLNITTEQHKASFNYLRALGNYKHVELSVN